MLLRFTLSLPLIGVSANSIICGTSENVYPTPSFTDLLGKSLNGPPAKASRVATLPPPLKLQLLKFASIVLPPAHTAIPIFPSTVLGM